MENHLYSISTSHIQKWKGKLDKCLDKRIRYVLPDKRDKRKDGVIEKPKAVWVPTIDQLRHIIYTYCDDNQITRPKIRIKKARYGYRMGPLCLGTYKNSRVSDVASPELALIECIEKVIFNRIRFGHEWCGHADLVSDEMINEIKVFDTLGILRVSGRHTALERYILAAIQLLDPDDLNSTVTPELVTKLETRLREIVREMIKMEQKGYTKYENK